jgi:uncharacterized protein (UPF0261 family)
MPTVLLIGAFDTKGAEYDFLRQQIESQGCAVMAMNVGVMGTTELFPLHVEADEVARAGGADLSALRQAKDRGEAMKVMSRGAAVVVRSVFDEGRFDGIIGMGGTGGTSVITAAMRTLPVGVPKLCISTAASSNTSAYVGISDIVMMPSIVDVAGVNRVSRLMMTRAAGAICGMVRAAPSPEAGGKRVIAASMFGNTTACVDACRAALEREGYEVLVFHATGAGGRTMEALVDQGVVDAVLDITTTEWADEICGGVFSAGPDRLAAPGRRGLPHLVAPGCVDMVNFGPIETVPEHYRRAGRKLYEWNPSVTLMRTNVEENRRMGEIFAEKLNAATGPAAVLLPLRGVSILDGEGQPFCERDADHAMFVTLRSRLGSDVPVIDVDANINDPQFSSKAVEVMLQLIEQKKASAHGIHQGTGSRATPGAD